MTKKHNPVPKSESSKKTDNFRRKVREKKAWQPVIDQTTEPPKGSGDKPKK